MTLKVLAEITSEFAKKTVRNPSFQFALWLPGRLKEKKLCIHRRTVNAPIKAGLYGLLARTIDSFYTLANISSSIFIKRASVLSIIRQSLFAQTGKQRLLLMTQIKTNHRGLRSLYNPLKVLLQEVGFK